MLRQYLTDLKSKGNFSWNDLSNMSGLPDATIRKIFSGETADPRFDTVVKLVTAMGGSLNDIVSEKKEHEIESNSIVSIKDAYEARISDLKATYTEHINSLQKDKKNLFIIVGFLSVILAVFLLLDILISNIGWIRY